VLDDVTEDKIDDVQDIDIQPLEVKIINQPKKEVSDYDSKDDVEYDELGITKEEIKEFEDGDTSG